jgi:MoaA/NifB/PqqE/SkfB family radical SAM enzyme
MANATSSELPDVNEIPVPCGPAHLRRFSVDGALLLFDRDSGLNALCEGAETAHLRQVAPRVVQFGLTNRCNLACHFCSRDTTAASTWTAGDVLAFARELADAGVLEIAFGGGEPWAFPGFADLVCRLHDETPLAVSFTTNGLAMTRRRLAAIAGRYGQVRLSLYDDNDWRRRVAELAAAGARFGVNYLVTPDRLTALACIVLELAALGCRDVLLLSYNGQDRSLHLDSARASALRAEVKLLGRALGQRCTLKLDVCWGDRMQGVPRLFARSDCGAGRKFVVVTSDRMLMPCSFHHESIPVASGADLIAQWRARHARFAVASRIPGCARAPSFGIAPHGPVRLEVVS